MGGAAGARQTWRQPRRPGAAAVAGVSGGAGGTRLNPPPCPCAPRRRQGVENKKTYELNEEEINKLREEVGAGAARGCTGQTHCRRTPRPCAP
jgi:hypothetical protein